MKVALCLSGQARTFLKCIQSQKTHIIDRLNPDIFIHTWSFEGHRKLLGFHNQSYSVQDHQKYIGDDNNVLPIAELFDSYRPKKIIVDDPDISPFMGMIKKSKRYSVIDDDFMKLFTNDNRFKTFNIIMQHYSNYKSNSLRNEFERQHHIKYDLVIRCRMDLFFESTEFESTLGDVQQNTIFLAPNQNIDIIFNKPMQIALQENGIQYMPNDQFAYGNSDAMNYYFAIYKYYETDIDYYPHHGEGSLSEHLWLKNKSIYNNIKINPNIKMKIYRYE